MIIIYLENYDDYLLNNDYDYDSVINYVILIYFTSHFNYLI
jgi:hypothetical protein